MSSKNVIAICAYNKPDLLFIYLEQLYSDETISDYVIEIHTEEGYTEEQDKVLDFYKQKNPNVEIKRYVKKKIGLLSGFHNILSSYLEPDYKPRTCDFVIVGEEDMLPTKDYIRMNKYVYDNYLTKYPRIMGLAHKRRPEAELVGDPEILIGDYQCTSFSIISSEMINNVLLKHFVRNHLHSNPLGYYASNFPNSRMSSQEHTHQDGAIERIMEDEKLFVLKPDQARSMHVGLSGGNFTGWNGKGQLPHGSLEERVSQWKELIKDGEKLRSLSTHPHDLVVTDPEGPVWNKMVIDTDRDLAKASSWWYDTNNEFKEYMKVKV